jgi:hypothetical protein
MEWTFLVVKKKFIEFLTFTPDAKIPSKRALNNRLIFGTVRIKAAYCKIYKNSLFLRVQFSPLRDGDWQIFVGLREAYTGLVFAWPGHIILTE